MKKLIACILAIVLSAFSMTACLRNITVEFLPNGGTLVSGELIQKVKSGGSAQPPIVVREGYIFEGWDEAYDNIRENTLITAVWRGEFAVTYDLNGGELVSGGTEEIVNTGSDANPPEVKRDGYQFMGWDTPLENVTGDLSVKAIWEELYTVTFAGVDDYLVSGDTVVQVLSGEDAAAPKVEREGWRLLGWDGDIDGINSSVTVNPVWERIELTSQEIFNLANPAVVTIYAYDCNNSFIGQGSGFFIDSKGTIITNYHVIEDACALYAEKSDGSVIDITAVIDWDEDADIAALKTSVTGSSYLAITDDDIEGGEHIYTLGASVGLTNTLSDGIISNPSRIVNGTDMIQISAPISPGNSGGPLINRYGDVIGINTASVTAGENLNFSVRITELKALDLTSSGTDVQTFFAATWSGIKGDYYGFQECIYSEYEGNNVISDADIIFMNGETIDGRIDDSEDIDNFYTITGIDGVLYVVLVPDDSYDLDGSLSCMLYNYTYDYITTLKYDSDIGALYAAINCYEDCKYYIKVTYSDPVYDYSDYQIWVICSEE